MKQAKQTKQSKQSKATQIKQSKQSTRTRNEFICCMQGSSASYIECWVALQVFEFVICTARRVDAPRAQLKTKTCQATQHTPIAFFPGDHGWGGVWYKGPCLRDARARRANKRQTNCRKHSSVCPIGFRGRPWMGGCMVQPKQAKR